MKKNYNKNANEYMCSMTIGDLQSKGQKFQFISRDTFDAYGALSANDYMNIVLFASHDQSNIGVQLSSKIEKHIDEIVDEIRCELDLKTSYFYKRYDSQSNRTDLKDKIKNNSNPYICMYVGDSFTRSLYDSVRNALAHGNIAKKGKYYYLFSFSNADTRKPIEQRRISFMIKTYSLKNLGVIMRTLDKYN